MVSAWCSEHERHGSRKFSVMHIIYIAEAHSDHRSSSNVKELWKALASTFIPLYRPLVAYASQACVVNHLCHEI